MIRIVLASLMMVFAFSNCFSQEESFCNNCGYASSNPRLWDSSAKKFMKILSMPDYYFWFRDSLIVYENYVLDTDTGPDGHTKYAFSITHYTFFDLRTKHGYDYVNFT